MKKLQVYLFVFLSFVVVTVVIFLGYAMYKTEEDFREENKGKLWFRA